MAAEHTLSVEVLTPEGEVFRGDVERLSTKTLSGEIGILANHVPLLAALKPNVLRLKISDSETRRYAQSHGMLQVFANHAQVLVEQAVPPEDLDAAALKDELADAEQRLEESEDGSAAQARARRDIERVKAFLAVAQGE